MRRRKARFGGLEGMDERIDPAEAAAYGLVLMLVALALQGVALSRPWLSDIGVPGDDPCRTAAWGVVGLLVVAGTVISWAWRGRGR